LQVEERLDHHRDLVLTAAAVGGDELLYLGGLVEGDGQTCLSGGDERGGPGLADGDGGAHVADDEVLDGDFVGAGIANNVGERLMDTEEALGNGGLSWRRDSPEGEGFVAVAFGAEEAVASAGEGGIDAEDGDGAAQPDGFAPRVSPRA
jgi:hypothetical protein